MGIPKVVFQPEVHRGMQRGINQLAEAIRPTLGPLPRFVAIDSRGANRAPEMLDDGGIIARRIVELPNRTVDAGAMYLRHVLWQVHEKTGDGVATTAVLFQAIYNEGVRHIVAGGNAMILRRHLEAGLDLILDKLNQMTMPLAGQRSLVKMAESVCYDTDLSKILGETFDLIGEYGRLEIRTAYGRETEREYVEGSYWDTKCFSNGLKNEASAGAKNELFDTAILTSDFDIDDPQTFLAFLTKIHEAGLSNIVLIAQSLSDAVLGMVRRANQESKDLMIVAVKIPGSSLTDQIDTLEDIAILTGGRRLLTAAGDSIQGVLPTDLGLARRAWVDTNYLGLVRGQGDPKRIRNHLNRLRSAHTNTSELAAQRKVHQRIGQLLGGTAVLKIGASTEAALIPRKELVERSANALRTAMRDGVVPGGGSALLACQPAIRRKLEQATVFEEQAAFGILHRSLEAPVRALISNAGYEASTVIGKLGGSGPGVGFNALSGQIINMAEAGIWDATAVLKASVEGAISGAALALTTDVLIQHSVPQQAMEP